MLIALWIIIATMLIIFAVLGVLYLAILYMNKIVRPIVKKGEGK